MKLLLSMHPWVRVCAAELNMSPFLAPGGALLDSPLLSHPLWSRRCLRRAVFAEHQVVCEIGCDHFHIRELKCVTFWQEVKLLGETLPEARTASLAGGSRLLLMIKRYVTSRESDLQFSALNVGSESKQLSQEEEFVALGDVCSLWWVFFTFSPSAVFSFTLITY